MRLRALPLLLSLTAGDYLLWHWSLTGGHDVLALASGVTLLPLATLSLGLIGLTALRVLARLVRRSSRIARAMLIPRTRRQPTARQGVAPATVKAEPGQPTSRPHDPRRPQPDPRWPQPDPQRPQSDPRQPHDPRRPQPDPRRRRLAA